MQLADGTDIAHAREAAANGGQAARFGPLLREWRETGVGFEELVTHIVVHEVGHHFGLSDDDMHRIEDEP